MTQIGVKDNGVDVMQVYSEDLLSICVQMVKEQLAQVIVPILQGMAGESMCHASSLRYLN